MSESEKYSLFKDNPVALISIFVLALVNIGCAVVEIVNYWGTLSTVLAKLLTIVVTLAALYYAVFGYRKPHGNHMKYLCMVFAAFVSAFICLRIRSGAITFEGALTSVIMILLSAYMAGRLYKFKENVGIIILVALAAIANGILALTVEGADISATYVISSFNKLILWLTVAIAYVARYKAHKEAGLKDKEKI